MLTLPPHDLIYSKAGYRTAQVTICLSLFNYQDYIIETLESLRLQTCDDLDLILVEDRSTDDSLIVAGTWLQQHTNRFNRLEIVRHKRNEGLAWSRNTAIRRSQTPYVFIIDADNLLFPRCIERCVEALNDEPQVVMGLSNDRKIWQ